MDYPPPEKIKIYLPPIPIPPEPYPEGDALFVMTAKRAVIWEEICDNWELYNEDEPEKLLALYPNLNPVDHCDWVMESESPEVRGIKEIYMERIMGYIKSLENWVAQVKRQIEGQ